MGFLDKVKEAASDVAAEEKKGDDFAKQLGYLIYKERRHDKPAGEEAERLMTEMAEVEKTLGAGGTDAADPADPADPADSPDKGEASEGSAPA